MQDRTLNTFDHLSEIRRLPEDFLGLFIGHFTKERQRARLHSFSEVSELVLHDLTNPLSVVRFCIEQLEVNPGLIKEKPQYLEKIKNNIDRAFGIIDSFRSIVRQTPHVEHCAFEACHHAAIKLIQNQFKEGGKELAVDLDPSLEGVLVRIPQFDAVFILDTIYRILLSSTSHPSEANLKVRKENLTADRLNIKISSISRYPANLEDQGLLNLINLRVINQQLANYGGHVVPMEKSLTVSSGTDLTLNLPLVVGE